MASDKRKLKLQRNKDNRTGVVKLHGALPMDHALAKVPWVAIPAEDYELVDQLRALNFLVKRFGDEEAVG